MKETRTQEIRARSGTAVGVGVVGVGVLAAAAVIAGGTQAYAEVVRFDNPAHGDPGHFHWAPGDDFPGQDVKNLNITWDASLQPAPSAFSPGVFGQKYDNFGYPSMAVQTAFGTFSEIQAISPYGLYYLEGVSSGALIPSGLLWNSYAYVAYGPWSYLPEGTPTYLGTRTDFGGGYQYGWIGVVRSGIDLEAFAWGYETVPGVPIAAGVPAPGTLALLAFGAATGLTRKRRTDN